jgi:hypothetical protein
VGTRRGGTKLHASVAGSRVIAFLATAAPWEPYFTDNLEKNKKLTKGKRKRKREMNLNKLFFCGEMR